MGKRTTGRCGSSYRQSMVFRVTAWCSIVLTMLFLYPSCGIAEGLDPVAPTGDEDGGIKQHEQFEFEAFINHDDIKDGTEPFDANNDEGNDSAVNNKIVRTFDTITYPLKVTVNPKKVDKLENIKLSITGTLENGITDGRVNGKFAVGGSEDMSTGVVRFTQDYTIKQTGNSIMIPVTVEVQGARHGTILTPKLAVEVVSVDGQPITGIKTTFKTLPPVAVSAKVNVRPLVGSGLAGQGIPYFATSGISGDKTDKTNTHAFSLTFSGEKLPGRSDMRGSTFPDPKGELKYRIEMSGWVTYDALPVRNDTVQYNFEDKDQPFLIYDHQPINEVTNKVGAKYMLMDGVPYGYRYRTNYVAPQSQLPNLKPATIEKYGHHMVWGSGEWDVSAPNIQKNKVVYEGTNKGFILGSTFPTFRADGYTGSAIYGQTERAFSSHAFVVRMPNEYRIKGPLNKEGLANNAYYRAQVFLESYTSPDGVVTPFNKSSSISFDERNNPNGSYSVQTTFFAYPNGKQLGTPNIGWSEVSKGDASTLIGENVYLNTALGSSVNSDGGFQALTRWNTDSFELTEAFAKLAKESIMAYGYYTPSIMKVSNDPKTQTVRFGVQKFPKKDNVFEVFTKKGIDDYTWYDTYAEAVKHGAVGALQNDVTAPTGPKWTTAGRLPLRVKHENIGIGSFTRDGSANVALTNYYPYADEERTTRIDVTKNQSYNNPSLWDDNGIMTKKQSPSGSTVSFETLGVQPAMVTSELSSDKDSYYNSESIDWTVKNSIVLPTSGLPDKFDTSIKIKEVLPKGLTYTPGSGKVGDVKREPIVTKKSDGTTELEWEVLFALADNGKVDPVTYTTSINPFALSQNGVSTSLEVNSIATSDLDQRPIKLRTSSKSVTILKVGMVGIFETIDKADGGKNSSFTLSLKPYTTIEDEKDVTGLTVLPQDGDDYGSTFNGTALLDKIKLSVTRKYVQPVKLYVNEAVVRTTRPHEVDVSANGWKEYEEGDDTSRVKTVLFKVEGLMTNTDDITIDLTIKTQDNSFGNVYLNETVINSGTNYRLSPVSNRVRYAIRADLELGLGRIRIYTDTASNGLPVSVRVNQVVLKEEAVKDKDITLALYDKVTNKRLTSKTFKQSTLQKENLMRLPNTVLFSGTPRKRSIEARIEAFDDSVIWVRDGDEKIDTDAYVAEQKTLISPADDLDAALSYKGVAVSEREFGKAIQLYYETVKLSPRKPIHVKAGYSFPYDVSLTYTNELLNDVASKVDLKTTAPGKILVENPLIDDTYEHKNKTETHSEMNLDSLTDATFFDGVKTDYKLQPSMIDKETGNSYTQNQVTNATTSPMNVVAGGNRLYVPTWIDEAKTYGLVFAPQGRVGSNQIAFVVASEVDVFAYMFSHIDSQTKDDDELLIQPKTDVATDVFKP